MSEIKRKKSESFESFLRRVKKRWQQSGKILQVKKIQFFDSVPNKNARRRSALHRLAIKKKMDYLKKIGKLPEEQKFIRK
jgi:ribosomal protein S21